MASIEPTRSPIDREAKIMTMNLEVRVTEIPAERRQTARSDGRFRRCWLPSSGVILNLGEGGAALETLELLEPGQQVTLRVDVDGGTVRVSGRVRWSRQVAGVRLGAALVPVFQVGVLISAGPDAMHWREVVNGAGRRAMDSSPVDGSVRGIGTTPTARLRRPRSRR